jgi:hypothetical protein
VAHVDGAFEDGTHLGDDLGEVDLTDAGQRGEQGGSHGPVQVGDRGEQRAQQAHLGAYQLGEDFRVDHSGLLGGAAQPLEKFGWGAPSGVGVASGEHGHARLTEAGGGGWSRVFLQEGQGYLRVQPSEDASRSGPVPAQQGGQLVGGGHLRLNLVGSHPARRLQLGGGGVEGLEAVPVGAQLVGQLVAVAGVGLGPAGAPAGPRRVERVGVDGHHRVPGRQESVHHQTRSGLDDHGKLTRISMAAQPGDGGVYVGLGWRSAERSTTSPSSTTPVMSWVSLAQSHPANTVSVSLLVALRFTSQCRGLGAARSLFGPRSGMFPRAVSGLAASGVALLSLAVEQLASVAIPRALPRSRTNLC